MKVGDGVAQCDGENEVCVCGVRRCAKYEPKCGEAGGSGYEWRFEDDDDETGCVDPAQIEKGVVVADPATPENSLCPEVYARPKIPEKCGDFDEITQDVRSCASSAETCVCTGDATGVCATALGACPSGYAARGKCISLAESSFVQALAVGQLCSPDLELPSCGSADAAGRLAVCGGDQVCACDGGVGACATNVSLLVCESGLLHEGPGYKRCAPVGATAIKRGACPTQPELEPLTCGAVDASGRVSTCAPDERCVCSAEIGAMTAGSLAGSCARAVNADGMPPPPSMSVCASGFEYVHDLSCVEPGEMRASIVLPAGATLCPPRVPAEMECGNAIERECSSEALGCFCSVAEPACVVRSDGCDSRLAFAGSGRCAPAQAEPVVRQEGRCGSLDPGDGGSGGETNNDRAGLGGAR